MENKDFFKWYKTKITDNAQDPPDDAWQNIADELDTNDVWGRVSAELDHRGGWFGQKTWQYALPAILLLLIPAGLYFYYNNTDKATPSTTVAIYADADSNAVADKINADDNAVADGKAIPDNNAIAGRDADVEDNVTADNSAVADRDAVADDNAVADRDDIADDNAVADGSESVQSSRFKVQGSEEVPGSRFQVQGSEEVPGSKFEVQGSEVAVPGSKFQVQGSRFGVDSSSVEAQNSERKIKPLIVDRADAEVDRKTSQPTEEAVFVEAEIAGNELSSRESGILEDESSRKEKQVIAAQPDGYTSFALRRMTVPDSMLTVDPLVVTLEPDSFDTTIDLPSILFSRSLEFGISGSVKNTWLLNSTTFMGLERHTLTTTLPDFGKDVGVVVRYTFSPKFSAQAEGFFISDMGQRYNEYRKGKYIERDVDLNYFHGNLLFRYGNNATLLGRLVNGHGIIAGIYYSKLKDASETIDGHTTDITTLYSLSDYGIVIGYEYNQHLFSNFFFTTGARINYGLKDIRSHATTRTGTGSFDVNFGLRYRFSF